MTAQRPDLLRRIDAAITLLEDAISARAELPALADLAQAAHLSPFHFHRIYRALTGETVGRSVLRLRLVHALHLLRTSASITDVALAAGYDTPQAFARVVKQTLGHSPSTLREQPSQLDTALQTLRTTPRASVADPAPALRVEVVSIDPFRVSALRNVGDYADLDQAYTTLFGWAAEQDLLEHLHGIYGLPHGDRRDIAAADYVFDCALAFTRDAPEDAAAGVRTLALDGGRYARLRHVGSYMALEDLTDALLAQWWPASGETLRDAPIFHHYLDDPEETAEATLRSDIYLPLA